MFDFIRANAGSTASKVIFGIIILVFVFWGVGNFGSAGRHSVGEVNGDSITINEYARTLENALERSPELQRVVRENEAQFKNFKHQIFDSMAMSKVVEDEARALGLFVAPQELRVELANIGLFQDDQGKFDVKKYEQVLSAQKISPGAFEQDYIRDLLMRKLQHYVALSVNVSPEEARNFYDFTREERIADYILFPLEDYREEAKPDEAQIEAFYAENKEQFKLPARGNYNYISLTPHELASNYEVSDEEVAAYYEGEKAMFMVPEKYEIQRIVLTTPAGGTKEDLDKKIAEINKKLEEGSDILSLVKEYTALEEEKEEGGYLGWIASTEFGMEISEALEDLPVGTFSKPIDMGDSVHLFYLKDKTPESTLPLEDVKLEVKKLLAEEKANADFSSIHDQAEEALRLGKDFAEIAQELKLELKSTGLIPSNEAASQMGIRGQSIENLSYIPAGSASPAPLEVENGLVLVFVKELKPEEIPPQAEVQDEIIEILSQKKSQELAKADAAKTLLLLQDSEREISDELKEKIQLSKKFIRVATEIKPLGRSTALIEDLFIAPPEKWLAMSYEVPEGVVLAKVKSIIPAPESEWEALGDMFTKSLLDRKKEIAIQGYILDLLDKAKITRKAEIIDSLPLRF